MIKKLIILIIISILIYLAFNNISNKITGASIINTDYYLQENGNVSIYFCPHDNCEQAFLAALNQSQHTLHCALYEIGLPSVQNLLQEKSKTIEVQIVTDDEYYKKFPKEFVKKDKSGLMHNKFCIIDNQLLTAGSMNPTDNDAHKNNNNLLIINSTLLAKNYEDEFQEMWHGTFKKGNQTINNNIMINHIKIENYFCPEDHCAQHTATQLSQAKESIYFMTFSFTNQEIANQLLIKNLHNLTIKGIMEVKQIDKDSAYQQLLTNHIDVIKDQNKYNLHHKVFIIDQETVVTGSFNPTANGDKNNDENILIIHDKDIAKLYLKEFNYLWQNWTNQTLDFSSEETENLEELELDLENSEPASSSE